jgi:hypothetical protein
MVETEDGSLSQHHQYGRVTSHLSGSVLCLHESRFMVDDGGMETTLHIYQHTCNECDRPALTFDEDGVALCSRHATIFIAVHRVEPKDDEYSIPVFAAASV